MASSSWAKLDDLVEAGGHVLARQAEQRAVEVDVLPAGELRVDARPHLDERADPPADVDPAGVGVHDPGQDLQQRRLARAVDADQADRLARLDDEVDVLERPAPAPPALALQASRLTWPARARSDWRVGSARNRFQMSVAADDRAAQATSAKPVSSPLEQQVAGDQGDRGRSTPRRWPAGPAGAARRAGPSGGSRRSPGPAG